MRFQDFDAKLRMTAAALGCGGRKEFVARFRAANPSTKCDLDRMHKWLQGRAYPREAAVLDDWARVVGSKRAGGWLAECSLAEFAAEIGALSGHAPEALLKSEPFSGRGTRTATPAAAAAPQVSGVRFLCGAYATYSAAWSPYAQGKLIRGALTLAPARGSSLAATYTESLLGKPVRLSGQLETSHRTLHMRLHEPGGELPLFFSLFLPRPPAGVLCGILSGVTLVGPEPEPSAAAIAMVRVPEGGALESTNRYLAPAAGTIAADLAALGLRPPNPARLDSLVLKFLLRGKRMHKVAAKEQAALAAELDPLHIAGDSA